MPETPHSEFILSDARDDWWNHDFLALMASRLGIARARKILDVGAGHGHWGQLWAPYLADEAAVVGVDAEPRWVEAATKRAVDLGLAPRFSYVLGRAEALPAADASFDMVTCQTLLMHVGDPAKVIAEMKRVLAPGGLLLLSEPNNIANLLLLDSTQQGLGVAQIVALLRFHLTCNEGRKQLGEGDYAIGDRLPQLLADAGVLDVRVHMNDHTAPIFRGPNNHPRHWAALEQKAANIEAGAWLWARDAAARLYVAGGGAMSQFGKDYEVFMNGAHEFVRSIHALNYSATGGAQHYLISGRIN